MNKKICLIYGLVCAVCAVLALALVLYLMVAIDTKERQRDGHDVIIRQFHNSKFSFNQDVMLSLLLRYLNGQVTIEENLLKEGVKHEEDVGHYYHNTWATVLCG